MLVMIRNSFIFLDMIQEKTERSIWQQGIKDWNDFLNSENISGISKQRKKYYDRQIMKSIHALRDKDLAFFTEKFPNSEQWRLFDQLENACYVDIETSQYYGDITILGISDGENSKTFVKDYNLDKTIILNTLLKFDGIITFNGSSFDIPIIERWLKDSLSTIIHIDLRHLCQKTGLTGGLKEIERCMGVKRNDDIKDLDTLTYWNQWQKSKDSDYLEKLIQYNKADVDNMIPLMRYCYKEMIKRYEKYIADEKADKKTVQAPYQNIL